MPRSLIPLPRDLRLRLQRNARRRAALRRARRHAQRHTRRNAQRELRLLLRRIRRVRRAIRTSLDLTGILVVLLSPLVLRGIYRVSAVILTDGVALRSLIAPGAATRVQLPPFAQAFAHVAPLAPVIPPLGGQQVQLQAAVNPAVPALQLPAPPLVVHLPADAAPPLAHYDIAPHQLDKDDGDEGDGPMLVTAVEEAPSA